MKEKQCTKDIPSARVVVQLAGQEKFSVVAKASLYTGKDKR